MNLGDPLPLENRRKLVEAGLCRWIDEPDGEVEMTDEGRAQAEVLFERALQVAVDSVIAP